MEKPVFMRAPNGEVFETSCPEFHNNCERLTQKEGKAARMEYCRTKLRGMIKPGQTVYALLRHVSSSGMSRRISLFIVSPAKNGQPASILNIDSLVADATGHTLDKNGGIRVSGCGMDMGFYIVHSLADALWPHGTRKNGRDTSGGYTLKHEWL